MKPEKLTCRVQNYEWGRLGKNSTVANLKHAAQQDFVIDDNKPYAELWMGVHPNGPSVLASTGQSLSEFIAANPGAVGAHEKGTLQFLFKALSVNKALSIQSHPSKEKAKLLRARDPEHYPDDNHKPEMAIALTDFQLLCGFRTAEQIHASITTSPELCSLINNTKLVDALLTGDESEKRDALQRIFLCLMTSPDLRIASVIRQMIKRLNEKNDRSGLDDLLIRLNTEYPNDVGILAAMLLNYFTLTKGESVFLGPNQPHAYLLGDCIECMACSDNTVRAGLTPKFRDVVTLCSDLTFAMSPPPYFTPNKLSDTLFEYAPPVPEFAVHHIQSGTDQVMDDVHASSILLLTGGSAELVLDDDTTRIPIATGDTLFIPLNAGHISIRNASADFSAYRAFTPLPQ